MAYRMSSVRSLLFGHHNSARGGGGRVARDTSHSVYNEAPGMG